VPTYDYRCRSCGSVTEVIHSMLEDGPTTCERCGGELRRVLFPSGIIFKGSGFYRTDSRSSSSSGESGSASASDTPAAAAASEAKSTGTKAPDAGKTGSTTPAGSD
jgi:putative FmdB family regulatory protein